jgi:hypothetical protein
MALLMIFLTKFEHTIIPKQVNMYLPMAVIETKQTMPKQMHMVGDLYMVLVAVTKRILLLNY